MVERTSRIEEATGQEGTWVDEVLVITGRQVLDLNLKPEMPVVDSAGGAIGRIVRIEDSGPDGNPEAFVMPSQELYTRIGSERGGNNLGLPAERLQVEGNQVRLDCTIDELFAVNKERGGTPKNLDVSKQLGVDPRE
ncbi:MAG TPA: hypothetical protein VNZ52_11210 [Candidatus Thermoplasmatota archaeon]|nr:hypothetical protein [Candidatus Thermoplasmatota archaeon]